MITYDLECYPNVFLAGIEVNDKRYTFENSWRVNEISQLLEFLDSIRNETMTGYNNLSYDWPVLNYIIQNRGCAPLDIYNKSDQIIKTPWNDRFSNIIWNPIIKQRDLLRVMHYDNPARMTGLKALEFVMRSHNIEDLPYTPGSILNFDQYDFLRTYMWFDIENTKKFCNLIEKEINFRKELSEKYDKDFTNASDAKIGSEVFIQALEKVGVECYNHSNGQRAPKRTVRENVKIKDCIFPYIKFEHPEFQRIKIWLEGQTVTEVKNVFKDLKCHVNGIDYIFGTGGLHASVNNSIIESDEYNQIVDVDVTSMYPSIAIVNKLYPEHLGIEFCSVYEDLFNERKKHKKGTAENASLKIAMNATYGNSGNKYSPFFDLKYLLSTTINGQLSLLMLVEQLIKTPSLKIIQCNTDGISYIVSKKYIEHCRNICKWWESITKLQLEEVFYKKMVLRDVNNYIGVYPDGKLKRKGCYCFGGDLGYHQNHSSQVVPMAANQALLYGKNIEEYISTHSDIFDFMNFAKVPRSSKLITVDYEGNEEQIQNNTRYYISVFGLDLVKIMPPTPQQVAKDADAPERRFMLNKGWKASVCNDMDDYDDAAVEYEYYIREAHKIVDPILKGGVM
ncbi:MAG: hypothetical protein J7K40_13660 [candidate division Zixibacteria bacterium]|nr:hypothetical protein [candidate division Zixibacteria bacterium]